MRIRLFMDESLQCNLRSGVAAFSLLAPLGEQSDALSASSFVVWDINSNIPLGSFLHVQRLHSIFALNTVDDLALFRVAFQSHSQWSVGAFVDPSRTACDIGLKDESTLFLTRNPSEILAEAGYNAASPMHFWIPLSTAAMAFEEVGAELCLPSANKRRVWKGAFSALTHGTVCDGWSGGSSLALARYPASTLFVAAEGRAGGQRASIPLLQWTISISFIPPKSTNVSRGAKQEPPPIEMAWVTRPGEHLFASSADDDTQHDDRDAHTRPHTRTKSIMIDSQDGNGEEERGDKSSDDQDDEVIPEVGVPFPKVRVGLGVPRLVSEYIAQGDDIASTNSSGGRRAQPAHEAKALASAVMMLDVATGVLFSNTGTLPASIVGYADLHTYRIAHGMRLTFTIDANKGILNIVQDGRVVLVSAVPHALLDCALSNLEDADSEWCIGDDGVPPNLLSPVIEMFSAGAVVDLL